RAIRMNGPAFNEQFQRMLMSKLRVIFENASSEVEAWNQAASQQIDGQFRERRKGLKRRREALERIQMATGELEQRLSEVETHDGRLMQLIDNASLQAASLRERAERGPAVGGPAQDAVDTVTGGEDSLVRSDGLALP